VIPRTPLMPDPTGGTLGGVDVLPGVNRLSGRVDAPSVGDGGAELEDGDVVVVVVVVYVCPPLLPHAVATAPIAISAEPLATTIRRRLILPVNTIQ
jgi:hypothetical protein